MRVFALPDLGEGLQEAEIVEWHVEVGATAVADQPLVSVETDKAVVEIPSPRTARITRRFGEPGDVIRVGAPLAEFEADPADEGAGDPGAIVGELSRDAASASTPQTGGRRTASPRESAGAGAGARVKAAPAVRARARALGIELEGVVGSGPAGVVTTADVERAALERGGYTPLRGARRSMADHMARAQAEVARTTVVDEADVDVWRPDTDVTSRLVGAIVAACRAEPALNAWYDARAGGRIVHERIDLGLAVDTPEGLFVPVLRDAANITGSALRERIVSLREAAEQRTLTPDSMRGPTFSLSNFGTLAGRFAVLMLVPPQVAILGAGRIEERVVALAGQPVIHRMLPLSLTFDHRVVTGGEAARFLAALIGDLQRGE